MKHEEPEKKIFLDKTDDMDIAVSKIKKAKTKAKKFVLNIPMDSVIGAKADSFQTLRLESDKIGKEVSIESVDEHILELAAVSDFEAVHPLFRTKEKPVFDISPARTKRDQVVDIELEKEENQPEQFEHDMPLTEQRLPKTVFASKKITYNTDDDSSLEEDAQIEKRNIKRIFSISFAVFVGCVSLGAFFTHQFFAKADISMAFQKKEVPFQGTLEVNSHITEGNISNGTISVPGELIKSVGNLTLSFEASGKTKVEEKAKGVLMVKNLDTNQQVFVATTRFESPDGKVFRAIDKVVVPGAKMVGGVKTPGIVDVQVVADGTGDSYNVSAQDGWKLPGLKSSPKYSLVSAESKSGMTGGFVGERVAPTDEEIRNAKNKTMEALGNSLKTKISMMYNERFKVFEESEMLNILKEDVIYGDENSGKFSVFMDGEMSQMIFEEETVRNVLTKKAKESVPEGWRSDSFVINYNEPEFDAISGKMSFLISGNISFIPDINTEEFSKKAVGKNAEEIKAMLVSVSGVESVKISLWPFWVGKVPERVNIEVQ